MSFADEFIEACTRLYRAPTDADGIPSEELDEVAARLGIALPHALREVYRLTGRWDHIHQMQDYLRRPQSLSIEDGRLFFYAENQGVAAWATDLSTTSSDPPVMVQSETRDGDYEWFPVADHISDFLNYMLRYQGVCGSLPHRGIVYESDEGFVQEVARDYPLLLEINNAKVYERGTAVVIVRTYHQAQFGAATPHEFAELRRMIGERQCYLEGA